MARLYKTGDRVERIGGGYEGEECTVIRDQVKGDGYISVQWDNGVLHDQYGPYGRWFATKFKLLKAVDEEPPKPIGVSVTPFVDTDGKDMLMISCTKEQGELMRVLFGHQSFKCIKSQVTDSLWNKLRDTMKGAVESELEVIADAKTWKFTKYEAIEGDHDG